MAEKISETLHTIFDGTACPKCDCKDGSQVKTTDLEFGAFIRICSSCNWTTGVDDSANLCDLGEENWEFEPTDGESGPCLENTNHHPVYIGVSRSGLMRSRCWKCKKLGIMFYKGHDFNAGTGEFRDTDSMLDTIFKNILEESGTNSESELLSNVLQELKENDEFAECMPTLNIVCDCGNSDPEYVNQIHNSSGTVVKITCLQCSAEYSPDLDSSIAHIICEKCKNNVEDCFEKTFVSGNLVQVKCLQCYAKFSPDLNSRIAHIICEKCKNNVEDCFEKTYVSGNLVQVKCLQCYAKFSPDLNSRIAHIICEKCKNNVEDCFEKTYVSGNLVQVKCFQCEHVQKLSETSQRTFENTGYIHQDRVTSWDMIERGNHISWQRGLSYEHHAIVLSLDPTERKIKIIEYGFNRAIVAGKPTFARVQEREEKITDLRKIFLYRYDYDPENCYSPEKVVERAQSRIGERQYNILRKNCEHFATWCKTGMEYCSQILPLVKRIGHSAVAFVTQFSRPLINLIKGKVFTIIASGASVDDVVNIVQQIAKADSIFKIGMVGFAVLLNLVVELCLFYHNYTKAKKDFDNGKIKKTEFRKRMFELIGESIGGLTLGLLLGFTWLLGPGGIPLALILSIFGNIGGRLLGAWIGRKLHNLTLKV